MFNWIVRSRFNTYYSPLIIEHWGMTCVKSNTQTCFCSLRFAATETFWKRVFMNFLLTVNTSRSLFTKRLDKTFCVFEMTLTMFFYLCICSAGSSKISNAYLQIKAVYKHANLHDRYHFLYKQRVKRQALFDDVQ